MWARVGELMIGLWLLASRLIFLHTSGSPDVAVLDAICGGLVVLFALVSYGNRLEKAHLLNILVALTLIGHAFVSTASPPLPTAQNHVLTGVLLLLFALVPSRSARPPKGWIQFYKHESSNTSSG